jgi:hypothetical protein
MPSPIPLRDHSIALWHLDSTATTQEPDYGSDMTGHQDFAPCTMNVLGSPVQLTNTPWGDFLDFSPAFIRLNTTAWAFGHARFSYYTYSIEAILQPGDIAGEQTFIQIGEDVPMGVRADVNNSRASLGINLTTNRIVFRARDPWAVDTIISLAPPEGVTFELDTFYYIAFTHGGTPLTVALYVDGVAGESASAPNRMTGTSGFTLGAMYPNADPPPVYGNEPLLTPFKGVMAGLHLYGAGGYRLDQTQITESWTAIQAALPPPITPAQAVIAVST